ncbi:MAG: superoxide dismutase, Ni [bacterium]|nr:superoxide dismutase, Ni [bacterium]
MLHKILEKLDSKAGIREVSAHCDIPCGIYDPISAQLAALSVVRMMDLMHKLHGEGEKGSVEYDNSMSRYVAVKEEHAEKCKHEIRIIWGDFIKHDQQEAYPAIDGIVHKVMQLGSACRQTANRESGLALVEKVNEFAEIFWKIKDIATKRAKAPYAPNLELVYPAL